MIKIDTFNRMVARFNLAADVARSVGVSRHNLCSVDGVPLVKREGTSSWGCPLCHLVRQTESKEARERRYDFFKHTFMGDDDR